MLERTYKNKAIADVVLTPPAVDPGLPPINIKISVSSLLPSVMAAGSTVLKPAVLAVTDANKLFKICPLALMPTIRFCRSSTQKSPAPPNTSTNRAISTSFVCNKYFRK